MAITIIQAPQYDTGSQDQIIPIYWHDRVIFGVNQSSDMSAVFKFKLILEVRLGGATGTVVAKIKQPWNGYEDPAGENWRSFFDIKDIIASYLSFTTEDYWTDHPNKRSVHRVGTDLNDPDKIFTYSNYIMRDMTVKAYCEYATTSDGIPEEQTGSIAYFGNHYMNATWRRPPYVEPDKFDIDYLPNGYYYEPGNAYKWMYSDCWFGAQVGQQYDFTEMSTQATVDLRFNDSTTSGKMIQFVNKYDYATIGFKGGDPDAMNMRVEVFSFSASHEFDFENVFANGGSDASPGSDVERVIHFGCGPQNLRDQSIDTDMEDYFDGTNPFLYYTCQLFSNDATPTVSSRKYYFVNGKYAHSNKACNPYNAVSTDRTKNTYVRLGWINSFGCWDYFNFAFKNENKLQVKEKTIKRTPAGKFDGEYYEYSPVQLNTFALGMTVQRTMTLNTGYVADGEDKLIESLFKSPLIHYIPVTDEETATPVSLKTQSITKKTQSANGRNVNYTFEIEFESREPVVAR